MNPRIATCRVYVVVVCPNIRLAYFLPAYEQVEKHLFTFLAGNNKGNLHFEEIFGWQINPIQKVKASEPQMCRFLHLRGFFGGVIKLFKVMAFLQPVT